MRRQVKGLGLALLLAATPLFAQAPKPAPAAPAAARQDYAPKPAMWLLQDADTKIYLFGTFHILPPGFRWRTAAFDEVVAKADDLVVESYQAPGASTQGEEEIVTRYFVAPKPSPILTRVPRKHRKIVQRALSGSELPVEAYGMMQTWAAGFLLAMADGMKDFGSANPEGIPGVEDQLEEAFRAAGKPISSIEDGDAVARGLFGFFAAMPAKEQSAMLVEIATEVVDGEDEPEDLDDLHNWARGRAETLADGFEEMPEPMYEVLITRRNAAWTDWLAKRLAKPGTVMLAVGAGHLAGPGSVQELLEKRGLAVTRVQ